jgi:hypothetical protein
VSTVSLINLYVIPEDIMPSQRRHPRLPPTKANFDADSRNKKKLADEFEEFKQKVKKAAKSSPAVEELIVPLAKLENAVRIGAWGIIFVPVEEKKRRVLGGEYNASRNRER